MTLRADLLTNVVDSVISNLTTNAILPASRHVVKLVNDTPTGQSAKLGKYGTASTSETTITPLNVELTIQYITNRDGAREKIGDAAIRVSQTITRSQLETARYITIATDGGTAVRYTKDNTTGIIDEGTGFFWKVFLQRLK